MKIFFDRSKANTAGFTLVEIMISLTIVVLVLGMCLSTFLFSLRIMYKDGQRLATNASLRTFMAKITNETVDASYFYLFPYYTALDGSVDLVNDHSPVPLTIAPAGASSYDKWIAHGDCLVLVTNTSLYRTTNIKKIRIFYRLTTSQTTANQTAAIRYYETPDTAGPNEGWGEGTLTTPTTHTDLTTELNLINLNSNPLLAGSKELNPKTKGRQVPSPYTGYSAGDFYPVFSTESPTASSTNGFISINMEFLNGTTANNMLSSSSFNYTISPRR